MALLTLTEAEQKLLHSASGTLTMPAAFPNAEAWMEAVSGALYGLVGADSPPPN